MKAPSDIDGDDDDEKEIGPQKHCELMSIAESVVGSTMRQKLQKESGDRYEVAAVYSVSNEAVHGLYADRKRLILRFSLNDDVDALNERKLWFSASRDRVTDILEHGFLRKFASDDALGFGLKFYRESIDALNGYGRRRGVDADGDGVYYLLFCRVVCGESCLGREGMVIPDAKPSRAHSTTTPILYETATDDVDAKRAKYWIAHLDHQAVPEYVVCCRQKKGRRGGQAFYHNESMSKNPLAALRNDALRVRPNDAPPANPLEARMMANLFGAPQPQSGNRPLPDLPAEQQQMRGPPDANNFFFSFERMQQQRQQQLLQQQDDESEEEDRESRL